MGASVRDGPSTAPDGGWGWAVCLGSFLIQALTIGITYTFGIVFVDLLEYFHTNEVETAWIGSIQPFLLYFTGLVAGPMLLRFGWRVVTVCGAVLSCTGFLASAFVPDMWLLYITYGVLTGVGNGLMYVTSMVAVQRYFNKRRALATGLAVSGSGVGTLVFGVAIEIMLKKFGWRYTLMVNAALCLVVGCSCALLFRPLPHPEKKQTGDGDNSSEEEEEEEGVEGVEADTIDEVTPLTSSRRNTTSMSYVSGVRHSTSTVSSSLIDPKPGRQTATVATVESKSSWCCGPCCRGSQCYSLLRETFDPSLFRNPIFIIICISLLGFLFGYHTPYTYMPERAIHLGVAPTKASLLISVIGISNVGARLLFGCIADRSKKIRFYFSGIVFCLSGIFTGLVYFWVSYLAMVSYCVVFGACSGCFAALFPVILVDLLGIDSIEKSLGQALAFASLAFLVASPLSGWLIDRTGSFDVPFFVVGALEVLAGMLYFSIKCLIPQHGYREPTPEVRADVTADVTDVEARGVAAQQRRRQRAPSSIMSESFT